ncbi:quinone-dependent dihydroorotate dehydrogenase [Campylobacter sp. 19-13652]|uniref:quinone-dependent dihydroorotate dehydrogenase n=1 Tax=Campylobacter sp. 19-13652 TaxID=2840180 RepID=UPI001C798DE6|nr:quinone-dependent dihydroorotate dehydrogenase [Campylobacter sp. 19-13652]BCX79466.1 dihydroorotate dehydrogenase (quinone) [Campylobacter sp. 19-13652]
MFDYKNIRNIFFKLDPEQAHCIAEMAMRTCTALPVVSSFIAQKACINAPELMQSLLGAMYPNPVMMAGGFDKNATMLRPLAALGFGGLEFGTFTKKAQDGNPKPRLFRLIKEESIQNSMGFNNKGASEIYKNVKPLYPFVLPIWANIGKNKLTPNENAIDDYLSLVSKFNPICDAFVINLSSPNTPNLRELLSFDFISELFSRLNGLSTRPVFLKISPDMSNQSAVELCKHAVNLGAAGVIVANTSTDYSLSSSPNLKDFGGLSGKVIAARAKELLKDVASELYSKCVIVASGGISSADEAYERIKFGASLVQVFSAFIYEGPFLARRINEGLCELLAKDGYAHISEAVGALIRKNDA